ncbi:MAG: class I adenylate-forming enzyme family protein [Dongiaceae bacterium]
MIYDGDSIMAALRSSALRFGEKACLVTPDRTVSFAAFYDLVCGTAEHLRATGIARGDRVAILDIDSIEHLVALYAAAALEAIAVPLNYRQRPVEIEYQLGNSGARLLLAGDRYLAPMQPLAPMLEFGIEPIRPFVAAAETRGAGAVRFLGTGSRSPFLICYTSGTTGRPKGAVLEQRTLWLRSLKYNLEFGFTPEDRLHCGFPMFHIGGLVYSLAAVMRGASLLILPQFQLEPTMAAVRDLGATFLATVPTMLSLMTQSPDFGPDYFGRLRLIMYGGAPMNPTLLRTIMSAYRGEMVQSFGSTEDLPQTLLMPADHRAALASAPERLSSIGRPPFGVEFAILDGAGRPVPQGTVGEIATRSGTNMAGYWQLPEETARTLKDGWMLGGDLGYVDADGFVHLAGRKKDMIIRGGENIYPIEVETLLALLPGVADCAVIGLPDAHWGEIVVAIVVSRDRTLDAATVIAHCRQSLASYRCPEKVLFRDELPRNSLGKTDRQALLRSIAEPAAG